MYILITTARRSGDLSIGLHRDSNRRQRELTNNKNQKGKYHATIMLRDVFGFAESHEKARIGLGFKLTLSRSDVSSDLNKYNATKNAKMKNYWY